MDFIERDSFEYTATLVLGAVLVIGGIISLRYGTALRDKWWGFGYQKTLGISEEIREREARFFGWLAIILGGITVVSVIMGGTTG